MTLRLPIKLRHVNTVLLLAILILDGYIIAAPFLPGLVDHPHALATPVSLTPQPTSPKVTPTVQQPNAVMIPAMQLNQPIYEGTDIYAELDKGVLRWPTSSTPDKGSNTVILGHRFTYTNPRGVFYFLNLVKVGDEIGVVWNNVTYTYRVDQTEVVSPSHTEILNPTTQPTLTLYTCTPTWWPVDRLVVIAHLEKQG